ncbi:MAG: hypothetical protein MHPSP_001735 [Paramarteilia canceri]
MGTADENIYSVVTASTNCNELLLENMVATLYEALSLIISTPIKGTAIAGSLPSIHATFNNIIFDGELLTTDAKNAVENSVRSEQEQQKIAVSQFNQIFVRTAKSFFGSF